MMISIRGSSLSLVTFENKKPTPTIVKMGRIVFEIKSSVPWGIYHQIRQPKGYTGNRGYRGNGGLKTLAALVALLPWLPFYFLCFLRSLYSRLSTRACQEASMILVDTPTVPQLPFLSLASTSTLTGAAVPALTSRTLTL